MSDFTKVGALWTRKGPNGVYLGGVLELNGRDGEKISIMVFKNPLPKQKETEPDYRIVKVAKEEHKETESNDISF
jgi:hypothetical protein